MNTQIVKSAASADNSALPIGYQPEPALLPPCRKVTPQFSDPLLQQAYPGFLSRKLQRNPRDLLAHVQRIRLLRQAGQGDACYAALNALFQILGTSGQALRKRLLLQCRLLLNKQQHQRLEQQLLGEDAAPYSLPVVDAAYTDIQGTLAIVAQTHRTTDSKVNVLLEPQLSRLESMVRSDPGDKQACSELLGLYQQYKLRSEFTAMHAELLSRRFALPEDWQATERMFACDQA